MPSMKKLFRPLWYTTRNSLGLTPGVGAWVRRRTEHHGSLYGGWTICPDGIGPDALVYAVGTGTDISFDLSLIQRYRLTVHAFDPTPRAQAWLAEQVVPERFRFHPFGLAAYDGSLRLHPPAQEDHVSFSPTGQAASPGSIEAPVHRLKTIMEILGHHRIDILKMDIEGGEYEVLDDILRSHVPIGQILVEFHHGAEGIRVADTNRVIRRLNAQGYLTCAVSPIRREYSFLKV